MSRAILNEELMDSIRIGFIASRMLLTLHKYKQGIPLDDRDKQRIKDALWLLDEIKKGKEEVDRFYKTGVIKLGG